MRSNRVITRAAKQAVLFACCVAGQLCCVAGGIAHHTSLREAIEASDTDSVLELLRSGVDPNMEDEDGKTPLHWARSAEVVRALLQFGADPNATERIEKMTPLHYSVSVDLGIKRRDPPDPAASKLLLQAGADPNAQNSYGKTPLFYAVDHEVAAALVEAGAHPNAQDNAGTTPLFHVEDHQVAVLLLEELLRSGVEPHMEAEDGKTPLHWARSAEVVRALLQFGADPNARDENDVTPLHNSVYFGFKKIDSPDPAASKLLLQAGADPNARDIGGSTPLFYAVKDHQIATPVAAALIEAGADPNARDIVGRTPLFYVEDHQVAAVLLQAGADPNVHDAGLSAPLHAIAGRCFDAETIEVLAHGGADTNASDANGRTPLFETVRRFPAKSCAAALLNAGANPDARDANGFSALHILILAVHPSGLPYDSAHEMATVLLDGGASLFVADDDGYPPLAAAMYHGKPHAKITDTILRYHFPTLDSEDPPDPAHSVLSSLGPGLHGARCWFDSEQAWPMKECFFMVVTEDQNDADSPLIAFPVVRFFEQSSPQAPRNPVLHLGGGGPGIAMGLESPHLVWNQYRFLVKNTGRDLYVIDPRGVGMAHPRFHCFHYFQPMRDAMLRAIEPVAELEIWQSIYRDCKEHILKSDHDLVNYNSSVVARDVDLLRRAIGAERFVLYGVSGALATR